MTTIRTRPYLDDDTAVTGRAATMPPVTEPGRPGRASRTRLRLAVAIRLLTRPSSWCHDPAGSPARTGRRPMAGQATTVHHQLSRHEEAQPTNPALAAGTGR